MHCAMKSNGRDEQTGMVTGAWITFDCHGTLIDWEGGVADALDPFLGEVVDRRTLAARYIAIEAEVERLLTTYPERRRPDIG